MSRCARNAVFILCFALAASATGGRGYIELGPGMELTKEWTPYRDGSAFPRFSAVISMGERGAIRASFDDVPGIADFPSIVRLAIGPFESDPGQSYVKSLQVSCHDGDDTFASAAAVYEYSPSTGIAAWSWIRLQPCVRVNVPMPKPLVVKARLTHLDA